MPMRLRLLACRAFPPTSIMIIGAPPPPPPSPPPPAVLAMLVSGKRLSLKESGGALAGAIKSASKFKSRIDCCKLSLLKMARSAAMLSSRALGATLEAAASAAGCSTLAVARLTLEVARLTACWSR